MLTILEDPNIGAQIEFKSEIYPELKALITGSLISLSRQGNVRIGPVLRHQQNRSPSRICHQRRNCRKLSPPSAEVLRVRSPQTTDLESSKNTRRFHIYSDFHQKIRVHARKKYAIAQNTKNVW